jgi:probable phosphoglycerate mutase
MRDPTTLLLARHARTAATEQGRFAGRTGDDLPLSATGEIEAERLARLVAGLAGLAGLGAGPSLPDVDRPSVVVSSPLLRARQTAAAAARALSLQPDDLGKGGRGTGGAAGITIDDGWVEASFGAWENLSYAEVSRRFPAELAAWQASPAVAPPGGDALTDVVARVQAARRRLVADHPGRCVLVVTHAGCVRAVVQDALDAGDVALWRTRVTPAGLTAVRYWPDGGVEVVTVNATAHLSGLV